jgi:hypothetical protein
MFLSRLVDRERQKNPEIISLFTGNGMAKLSHDQVVVKYGVGTPAFLTNKVVSEECH